MPKTSLAYDEAVRLLADGEWHDYAEVVRKVATAVPPAVAFRKAEAMRLARARQHGNYAMPEERKWQISEERQIEIGGTAIARSVLNNERLFVIEPRGASEARGGKKRVRMVTRPVGG